VLLSSVHSGTDRKGPLGPLLQANGYTAPEQFGPVLAAGPRGSFVVAWSIGPFHTTDILVRRFRR